MCASILLFELLHSVYHFFRSITAGEWLLFMSEIAVAAVIYFELEHSRRTAFLEKATGKDSDQERREIYAAYFEVSDISQSSDERANKFMGHLFSKLELKKMCDNEIALFNEIGFMISPWLTRKKPLVEIFPHAPVYIWLIVRPYVLQRRTDTGPYFACFYFNFTKRCLDYVIKRTNGLHLRRPDGSDGCRISKAELLRMREEIRSLS
jgi:hypothetical protein